MPKEDERPTGTLDGDKRDDVDADADASVDVDAGGSGSEDESPEERIARLERVNAQLLSEKTSREQTARENEDLKRKLAERDERGETPAPTADSSQRDLDKIRRQLDEDIAAFRADAAADDPVRARYGRQMLRQHSVLENQWREAQFAKDLKTAPADLRDDVEALIRKGDAGNIPAAIKLAKAERREREEQERDKDREDRNEGKRERRDTEPALGGGGGGAPRERTRPMTRAQVIERKNALRESGTMEERQKFQRELDSGRIPVRG